MTRLRLEMWINNADKIISFTPVADWLHQPFDSENAMMKGLEYFVRCDFRFQ